MILGPDRSRLSKRHGATSIQAFRDAGFLPEAMVNYLARLGWSHGDQELFSREELIELFDIKDVAPSAAIFDHSKLEWLNQQYLKRMDGGQLAQLAAPILAAAGLGRGRDPVWLSRVMDTLKERARTLRELVEVGRFYFERPEEYEPKAAARLFTAEGARRLALLIDELPTPGDFEPGSLEQLYRDLASRLGVGLVDLAQLTRLAITGRTASPPLFEVLALLGREETADRLRAALAAIGGAR
jgi:glutamyl-tRNA synthetase